MRITEAKVLRNAEIPEIPELLWNFWELGSPLDLNLLQDCPLSQIF